MHVIHGLSIFEGIVSGKAFVISVGEQNDIPMRALDSQEVEKDWDRFLRAEDAVRAALDSELKLINGDGRLILETHRMMLEDRVFRDSLRASFAESGMNIEYALHSHVAATVKILKDSGNAVLAERADDIADVFGAVMRELLGKAAFDFGQVPEGSIVVAKQLKPSGALSLFKRRPLGLCLAEGGTSGHLAILARAERLPAVFAAENAHRIIRTGDDLILDGANGQIFVDPDEKTVGLLGSRRKKDERLSEVLKINRDKPCLTKDGRRIFLFANIGRSEEALVALEEGADGIGLFRTEFLFMEEAARNGGALFSEDGQCAAYKTVLETMKGKPVVIRTIDAGGDKFIDAMGTSKPLGEAAKSAGEENPLLGERSIRLTLAHPEVFKVQLRALLRAGVHGDLRIMLPFVVSPSEVREVRRLISEVKKELSAKNVPHKRAVPVGIMVETPAAALASDVFAQWCDFFSIGTNDLTQYSLGIDRENPAVAPLFDEFHPAVLRLIKATADYAALSETPVSVCGEMAGTPEGAAFLSGLGINTLSMAVSLISPIKHALSGFSSKHLAEIAREALHVPDAVVAGKSSREAVKKLLSTVARKNDL